ncbi:hypothetical protein [Nitrosovibrio sp. Nv4]|uniref:hypothetical protein n=1 Tax=Nitrosovibrio sp. Nv4 TaxID=1945880 RepID=UPI000BD626B3|nr:hypothetical protein [Nitrosovibrio sp. Nv4]SOD41509.1 hypothetical protein SAMN06298226_1809 [Nitrosovibrio sp. Nv4]
MESLPVHLFRDRFGPFLLLNEHDLKYTIREQRSGVSLAASGIIEVLLSPYMWGALSTIIVAFLKYRSSRKVIITTIDGDIIQAEVLNQEEVERLLRRAKS